MSLSRLNQLFLTIAAMLLAGGLLSTATAQVPQAQSGTKSEAPDAGAGAEADAKRARATAANLAAVVAIAAESDYRIGTSDLIDVSVFGQPDLTRTVRVNARGLISLPLVGQVEALGLTSQQLELLIANRLSENYLQSPQVTIFIKEFTTLRFTVEGAVNKPGVYPIVGQMTLLRALAVAGGQGALSEMSEVMLFRVGPNAERVTFVYNAEKIRTGETVDPLILNDDLVVVKRNRARTALKDSLFRDILDAFNPIPFIR